jgi:hypothetical protein
VALASYAQRTDTPAVPRRWIASILLMSLAVGLVPSADAKPPKSSAPEIFFLGDSHLSFGAGKAFQNFFSTFEKQCKSEERWMGQAKAIQMTRTSIMGVKSTALHTWVSRHKSLTKMVCEPDPKWPVNARLYGFPHRKDGRYVQLGQDKSFPFCRQNLSALEAVFKWTTPRLMVFYFMGNTIDRWANSPKACRQDVTRLMKILPKKTGCVFMTTSPVYGRKDNARRTKAQNNIQAAFAQYGKRCAFVPMFTPKTVAAIQGRASYFRRHPNGTVKDPYHPGLSAARRLIQMRRRPICRAILDNIRPKRVAKAQWSAQISRTKSEISDQELQ